MLQKKYIPLAITPSDHNVCCRCHSRLDTCYICDNTLKNKYVKIRRQTGDKCSFCKFLLQDKSILLQPENAEYIYNNKCECVYDDLYIFYRVCEKCNNDNLKKINK